MLPILHFQTSQFAQWWLKNLPAMQEMCVQSLGREDALEVRMATHSSILAWRISKSWTQLKQLSTHSSAIFEEPSE